MRRLEVILISPYYPMGFEKEVRREDVRKMQFRFSPCFLHSSPRSKHIGGEE
jgi:hypothetical protein